MLLCSYFRTQASFSSVLFNLFQAYGGLTDNIQVSNITDFPGSQNDNDREVLHDSPASISKKSYGRDSVFEEIHIKHIQIKALLYIISKYVPFKCIITNVVLIICI